MASKDIYGGGNFGAIAGSLLSQRRSGFKKAIELAYEKIKLVYNELDKKTGLMSSHKLSLFI